jgi:hypothetical protein
MEVDLEPQFYLSPSSVKLPNRAWAVHMFQEKHFYIKVNTHGSLTHSLELFNDKHFNLKMNGRPVTIENFLINIETAEDLQTLLQEADKLKACEGSGFGAFSSGCKGAIKRGVRCIKCRNFRKTSVKKIKRESKAKRKLLAMQRRKKLHKYRKHNKMLMLKVRLKQ